MKTRYRFRFYPTESQKQSLNKTFGCCRYVYNWALRMRTDEYRDGNKIGYHESSAKLTKLKRDKDHLWLNDVSCVPVQQALRHLQVAFKNFFEKRAGYPSFKQKHAKQSAEYTMSAFKYDPETNSLSMSKLGKLKVRWSRSFVSMPTTVTITKRPSGRYYVTLCLDEPTKMLPKTGRSVGVDLGVSRLATLSTGERISNPRHLARKLCKLARLQRALSRKTKVSNRRNEHKRRIALLHERIADARADSMHKLTTRLVRDFDVICMEDLHVRGMVRNRSLGRSLSDVALGSLRSMVEYKCMRYGKECRIVDRFFPSSKTCSNCGYINQSLALSEREWACPKCGAFHDRDHNAAINLLAVGHTDKPNGRGGAVRAVRTTVRKAKPRRSANQPSCVL